MAKVQVWLEFSNPEEHLVADGELEDECEVKTKRQS